MRSADARDLVDVVGRLKQDLRQLERAYPASSGLSGARELSDRVDDAIRSIWKSAGGPRSGAALVATGGYGRRHMCPGSDIDLLVLRGKRTDVSDSVRSLSYALWDAGFELGLATATTKEALKLADTDFDTACSYLDSRLIGGDEELFGDFRDEFLRRVRSSPENFAARLKEVSELRWRKSGDAGAELEPDLKRSKGALRDMAVLGWISTVMQTALGDLPHEDLQEALDLLLSVRQGLHLETRRTTDLLSMQMQIPVARRLGFDEYELMRRIYRSCRPVAFAAEGVLRGPDPMGPVVQQFGSGLTSHPAGQTRPEGGVQFTTPSQWPESTQNAFFEILRAGRSGRRALLGIDVSGALPAALPEWNGIRHRAQRNIYHRWAVDIHCFETVAGLVDLAGSRDDLTRRVASDSAGDWDSLLLAGLLHDIGKGAGGDHSSLGERLADRCVSRMGIRASAARDVCWLVGNHLLLTQVATLRDISDEALIVDLAERVGSERRLRMLYLLSIADAQATGPSAWTPWKENLVSQLFSEVNHLLERKELVGGDASRKASARMADLRKSLAGEDPSTIEKHLASMPRAWLLSQDPPALMRQSEMMLNCPPSEFCLEARPDEQDAIWEVTVVAPDHPGLFSKVSGTLALHGFGVVSAQIFTREDGLALEVFKVEGASGRDDRFERVAADARRAIAGEISLQEALGKKRRDYSGRVEKGKQARPEVLIDNRASDFYTVIEVHATDRIGLLFEITSALADLALDIHLAKVATYAEDVADSFYVTDLDGQKITDPERLGTVQSTVVDRALSAAPDTI